MPTIRRAVTATTTDALQGVTFAEIAAPGAIVNAWVSSVTNGDTFGFKLGDREIVVDPTECNIEVAADCIDVSRDQVVFGEVVGPGRLIFPVSAVTTELQFLIHVRYLRQSR
jgi:hypothetical protein